MKLLVVIVKGGTRLEELLTGFIEVGITGATAIDARGMGEILSHNVPIFAGLKTLFPGAEGRSQVLLSVVDEEKLSDAFTLVEEICGSLSAPGNGIAFAISLDEVVGLKHSL